MRVETGTGTDLPNDAPVDDLPGETVSLDTLAQHARDGDTLAVRYENRFGNPSLRVGTVRRADPTRGSVYADTGEKTPAGNALKFRVRRDGVVETMTDAHIRTISSETDDHETTVVSLAKADGDADADAGGAGR